MWEAREDEWQKEWTVLDGELTEGVDSAREDELEKRGEEWEARARMS